MGSCPDDAEIVRFLEEPIDSDERERIEAHIDRCTACFQVVAELGGADATTAGSSPHRRSPYLPPGSKLGRYEVLDRLGAGGMGIVYRGCDPMMHRDVALKVVLPHADADPRARRRLLREARAMGQLSHENVVEVYDVGVADEHIYIAMELVEGIPLSAWLEHERNVAEILRVFEAAGRGLAAAHDAGLVHRDFKPSNVMVGDAGIKVLDFGLAQGLRAALHDSGQRTPLTAAGLGHITQHGTVVGTPAYMSPEQLAGEPSTARSDQFSFCVALFEALYGKRPYDGRLLLRMSTGLPTGPLSAPARPEIPKAVRRALVRGLACDPNARFAGMGALLAALGPSRGRWRPILLGAAGATLLLGLSTLGGASDCAEASARLSGVWDGERRAALLAAFENTGLPGTATSGRRVAAELDAYAAGWVDVHEATCVATRGDRVADARMACLAEGRRLLDAHVSALIDADARGLARALGAVKGLPTPAGCLDAGRPIDPSDPQLRVKVAAVRVDLARVRALRDTGDYHGARELAEDAARRADETGFDLVRAEALFQLGIALDHSGQPAAAEPRLSEAYYLAEAAGADDVAQGAARAMAVVAGLRLGRHDEGVAWAQRAAAHIAALGDPPYQQALWLEGMAALAGQIDDLGRALELTQQALDLLVRIEGERSWGAARGHHNLAHGLWSMGRLEDARREAATAVEIYEELGVLDQPLGAESLGMLGVILSEQGSLAEAIDAQRRVLEVYAAFGLADSPEAAAALSNLGTATRDAGRVAEAAGYLERAMDVLERTKGPGHPDTGRACLNLANAWSDLGRSDEAIAMYERARRIIEGALGHEHVLVTAVLDSLASEWSLRGDPERALALYQRSLQIGEAAGSNRPELSYALRGMGKALLNLDRPDEAAPLLTRAEALLTEHGADPADLTMVRFDRARATLQSAWRHWWRGGSR